MQDYSPTLQKYMPLQAAPIISRWINETHCLFRISRARRTKLGDYRAPFRGEPHRISVNHDLNPYAFLITTVHEFAHLKTWEKYQHRVKPHGAEWKKNFQELMQPFFNLAIFPDDVSKAIYSYMTNPAASSCTDLNLLRTLKSLDQKKEGVTTVESLEDGHHFQLPNGRRFQRLTKLRKRYKCIELDSQRIYLFHPVAEVLPVYDNTAS